MKINFELNESELDHLRGFMAEVRKGAAAVSTQELVDKARALIAVVDGSDTSLFIRQRVNALQTLIDMVVDREWDKTEDHVNRVIEALSYFAEPHDLIPDDVPGLGFLDDAIMIELVIWDLQHEIQAYQDYLDHKVS